MNDTDLAKTAAVALMAVILIGIVIAIFEPPTVSKEIFEPPTVSKEIQEIRSKTNLRCVIPKPCIMFPTAQERDGCISQYVYCEQ